MATCYAHAVAEAIISTNRRLNSTNWTHQDIVQSIIDQYGLNGAYTTKVLDS